MLIINNIFKISHNNNGVIYLKALNDIFKEFENHMLEDEKPSMYFNEIVEEDWFINTYPFNLIADLVKTEQSPKHHSEGNVWNHTMMVLDNAAERKSQSVNPRNFMWAALLHDIGKAPTTKLRNGRITSYDHDKVGEEMTADFLKCFTLDEKFIYEVSKLVRWHMQILFVNKGLPFANIKSMIEETSIGEVALLGTCDRLGRGDMDAEKIKEEMKNIEIFIEKCENFNSR